MKLFKALKIICLLLISGISTLVQAQYYSNPFYYSVISNTVVITRYSGGGGTVTIPGTISGLPVTAIGPGAFGNANMESVIIGTNVTNIGQGAFALCNNLTSVTMGTNVALIGAGAFLDDTKLASFIIPNSVTTIGTNAFAFDSFTNIAIPASVTNIGDYPFESCDWLIAITVDSNNPSYSSLAGVLFDKNQTRLIEYPAGIYASYSVPNSVASIADRAFYFCNGLRGLTMSTNTICIGSEAFNGCTQLPSLTIPRGVTNIGEYAFQQCTVMSAITVDTNNPDYTSLAGVLFDKSVSTLIVYPGGKPGNYTVPNSVTSIGDYAFQAGFTLTSVTIPNSVTNVGDDAFQQCYDLTNVYFEGNEPIGVGMYLFGNSGNPTIYYLPGATGWAETFGGDPTVLWNPQAQDVSTTIGQQSNQFGFTIVGSSNLVVVVEACTNLINPVWQPIQTNTLTGGSFYFSDPQWTNYPNRFYGFIWP